MIDQVSVLMSVYNTPISYLREAVDSILNQTYSKLELVIIDDASDRQDVIEYLNSLRDSDTRVCLLRNENNLGLTRSLNEGLLHCQGKYIARMDSDDVALPERVKNQVEYLESYSDVALVGSEIISFNDGSSKKLEPLTHDRCEDPEVYKVLSLIQHSGPPHPTFMFRSEFLTNHGIKYREDILRAQDYGIITDILKAGGEIRKIREPLLRYRIHEGQISSTSHIEQKAYQCRVSYDYIKYTFPDLPDMKCAAIALLGNDYDPCELVKAINNNLELQNVCGFLMRNKELINSSRLFVSAIKDVISINRAKGLFDKDIFEMELRRMWWKRALRISKNRHKPWGMWPYTLISHRYV